MVRCAEEGCERPIVVKGRCRSHYNSHRRNTNPPCSFADCDKKSSTMGLCNTHYRLDKQKRGPFCSESECTSLVNAKGLCHRHYRVYMDSKKPECMYEGCLNRQRTRGLCSTHYAKLLRSANYPCSVEGCFKPHYGLGLCTMHYQRSKSKDVLGPVNEIRLTYGMSDTERFLFYVDKGAEDGEHCWKWSGRLENGYGRFDYSNTCAFAHRYSYSYYNRIDLEDLVGAHIHHKCSVRSCVNPAHLQIATPADNTAEMLARNTYLNALKKSQEIISGLAPEHPFIRVLEELTTPL